MYFIPLIRPDNMSDNPSGSGLLDNRDSLATISKLSMAVALGTIAFVVWNTTNGVQNDGKIIAFGAISGTVGIMLQMVIRVIPNASSSATRANAEIIKETLVEAGVIPEEAEEEPEEEELEQEEEEPQRSLKKRKNLRKKMSLRKSLKKRKT